MGSVLDLALREDFDLLPGKRIILDRSLNLGDHGWGDAKTDGHLLQRIIRRAAEQVNGGVIGLIVSAPML